MAGDYIIQKAVAPSKVKKGLLKPLNTYMQQAKYDGCCAIMKFNDKGDYIGGYSRTRERYVSLDRIGEGMAATGLFTDVAVIGEAWYPGKGKFNQISGDFRRGYGENNLSLAINDIIPLRDFEIGHYSVGWWDRFRPIYIELNARGYGAAHLFFAAETWGAGSSDPQERANQLVTMGGFDGLILRDASGSWTVGRGTTGEILKIKAEVSLDLRVVAVNTRPGPKTGRPVYTLVVDYNGKTLGVGSGVPHELEDVPKVGDIVEITAMMESSEGLLREPRFKSIRFDKAVGDTD